MLVETVYAVIIGRPAHPSSARPGIAGKDRTPGGPRLLAGAATLLLGWLLLR
jgi:hypothetical protein